jgi:hypothetical protein
MYERKAASTARRDMRLQHDVVRGARSRARRGLGRDDGRDDDGNVIAIKRHCCS